MLNDKDKAYLGVACGPGSANTPTGFRRGAGIRFYP